MSHHNCRFCNYELPAKAKRCPECKRNQERHIDHIALLIIGCVVIFVAYKLFAPEPKEEPEPYKIKTTKVVTVHPTIQIEESESPPNPYVIKPKPPLPIGRTIQSTYVRPKPTQPKKSQYKGTQFLEDQGKYPFYVAERRWNSRKKKHEFVRKGMHGAEPVNSHDIRRYMLSENQSDYPTPESGCGPTALLNLYIWYSKFGLVEEKVKHSDPMRYKQLKFREIDRKISKIKGQARTPQGGTNALEQVIAIDEIVQGSSKTPLRIHFEYTKPPLKISDFLKITRNFRSGILSVQPKDPTTGRIMGNHAVLVVRGDTSGRITLSNWGEFQHGRLINKPDGQWFIPDDANQHSLKINKLTTLIPFVPKG